MFLECQTPNAEAEARATAPPTPTQVTKAGAVARRLQRLVSPGPSTGPRLAAGRAPPGAVRWNR